MKNQFVYANILGRTMLCEVIPSSARAWQCDLGNGEWDHDWQDKHDDAGEVDGIQGEHWSWRECRVCGEIEAPNRLLTE